MSASASGGGPVGGGWAQFVPADVSASGHSVALVAVDEGRVVRIEARFTLPVSANVAAAVLADLELASAGDTRLAVDAAGVVVTRRLADPDEERVKAAVDALAAVAVAAALGHSAMAEATSASATLDVAPPQPMQLSAGEAAYLASYRVAPTPQPAWLQPDPAQPPDRQISAGQWYQVLQEANGWAQVLGDDGIPVWTDGRTLVAPEELR